MVWAPGFPQPKAHGVPSDSGSACGLRVWFASLTEASGVCFVWRNEDHWGMRLHRARGLGVVWAHAVSDQMNPHGAPSGSVSWCGLGVCVCVLYDLNQIPLSHKARRLGVVGVYGLYWRFGD